MGPRHFLYLFIFFSGVADGYVLRGSHLIRSPSRAFVLRTPPMVPVVRGGKPLTALPGGGIDPLEGLFTTKAAVLGAAGLALILAPTVLSVLTKGDTAAGPDFDEILMGGSGAPPSKKDEEEEEAELPSFDDLTAAVPSFGEEGKTP